MTRPHIQNSLVAGEITPSIFGRTDLSKFHNGASTMRNFFVSYRGGAYSRAGYAFVGVCKQTADGPPPRDIPFQFSLTQGFALEFGNYYMRVKYQGAYVTEDLQAITDITNGSPANITYDDTLYTLNVDDWVYIRGVEGLDKFNNATWIVDTVNANVITVRDVWGNPVDASLYAAYIAGGTLARIYETVSPYAVEDLPFMKFVQNKDNMSITCVNQDSLVEYPPYELLRLDNTNWEFTEAFFGTIISAPTNLTATAENSTTKKTYYSYVVTAVDAVTDQESVPSDPVSILNNNISINAGSNNIKWSPSPNAGYYNVYSAVPSYNKDVSIGVNYGFVGTTSSTEFTDSNIVADYSTTPPLHLEPFNRGAITAVDILTGGSGYVQGAVDFVITTSTGTGFIGTPVVVSGVVTSFIVVSGGEGYLPTDSIAITTAGGYANGTITFTTNPTLGQYLYISGRQITFSNFSYYRSKSKAYVTVGATLTETLANLAAVLNASSDYYIRRASFSASPTVLTVTYKTTGTVGNSYTISKGTTTAVASGSTLTGGINGAGGGGATANMTVGPQIGTYPSVVNYNQQRRVYANTLNEPDTYFMSKTGHYLNFDKSNPTVDDDSIVGTPWAQQVNGIQFMQPMTNGLIVLTGSSAWNVNGGTADALTPSTQTAQAQSYNGCSRTVPPIVLNNNILYLQSKGSIVRDLSYNFIANVYTGADITVLSSHLFSYQQIRQWAYTEEPYKVIWAVRDDGSMLSLTYLKDQDVAAWARHDTKGFFVGVCAITEPPVDAHYIIVKRYVNGKWFYYSERVDNRNWTSAEDTFCVDSGVKSLLEYPNVTLQPFSYKGTRNITQVTIVDGGSGYTNPVARAIDSTGEGEDATFTVQTSGGVITAIIPDEEGFGYNLGKTTILITDPNGSGALAYPDISNEVTFETDAAYWQTTDVGRVIRIGNPSATAIVTGVNASGGGKAVITEFISDTEVRADIVEEITAVQPNDIDKKPKQLIPNQWSISTTFTVMSGFNHLEGETLVAMADGGVVENLLVVDGKITFPEPVSLAVAGLGYTCQLQTMYLEEAGKGTMQGKRKNITSVNARVEFSRGIEVGTNQPDRSAQGRSIAVDWSGLVLVKERNNKVDAGNSVPLLTGDFFVNVPASWDVHGQVAVQQRNPLPANILAITSFFTDGDTSDG